MTNEGRLALVLKKGSAAVAPETASLTADVLLFSGTPSYSWSVTGSAATIANTSGTDNTVTPVQGGISTVTVTADLGDRTLTAELDIYVLDIAVSGPDVPEAAGTAIIITNTDTDSTTLTASLAGIPALADAAYEWQVESPTVALASGTEGESVTITPAGPGTTAVKVRASYQGVASGNETWHRTGLGIDGIAGGQGTLTVSVDFGSRTLTKELNVYVLEPEITGTSPSGQALSADNTNPTILAGGDPRAMPLSVSLKNLDWSVLGDDLHVNWEVEEGYEEALTLTPGRIERQELHCAGRESPGWLHRRPHLPEGGSLLRRARLDPCRGQKLRQAGGPAPGRGE